MGKGPSSRAGSRHHQFRARAKTRVDDLQEMFSGLQSARKDSRSSDAAVLEEQLHQMLREWRAELSAPSPASSLQQGNNKELSDPPSETLRLLHLAAAKEEEDDATSKLVDQQQQQPPPPPAPVNQGPGHVQGGQDMKLEPSEETVTVAVAPQQPPLGQVILGNGGGIPAPTAAAAVFHDQLARLPDLSGRWKKAAKAREGDEKGRVFKDGEHLTLEEVLNATTQVVAKAGYKAKLASGGDGIDLRLLRKS